MPINTAGLERRIQRLEAFDTIPETIIRVVFGRDIDSNLARYGETTFNRTNSESEADFIARVDSAVSFDSGPYQVVFYWGNEPATNEKESACVSN